MLSLKDDPQFHLRASGEPISTGSLPGTRPGSDVLMWEVAYQAPGGPGAGQGFARLCRTSGQRAPHYQRPTVWRDGHDHQLVPENDPFLIGRLGDVWRAGLFVAAKQRQTWPARRMPGGLPAPGTCRSLKERRPKAPPGQLCWIIQRLSRIASANSTAFRAAS